jgi:hypothetical protein
MPITTVLSNNFNMIVALCELRHERANGRPVDKIVKYSNGLVFTAYENPIGLGNTFAVGAASTNTYYFEIRPGFGQSPSAPGYAVTTGTINKNFVIEVGNN